MKSLQIVQGYHQKIFYYMVSPWLINGFPTSNMRYTYSIPLNQIPFKYYNLNQSVGFKSYRDCGYTCNPHKFEIPAPWFPCRVPVIPCKHLQCTYRVTWLFSKQMGFLFTLLRSVHIEKYRCPRLVRFLGFWKNCTMRNSY